MDQQPVATTLTPSVGPCQEIMWKTEATLWEMLRDGQKTWEARRWDMADDRCYRLSFFVPAKDKQGVRPEVPTVSFLNKTTGEVLTFRYAGLVFVPWAPGWGFMLLGEQVEPPAK